MLISLIRSFAVGHRWHSRYREAWKPEVFFPDYVGGSLSKRFLQI